MGKTNKTMKRHGLGIGLLLVVIVQIFILINMPIANSYSVSETNDEKLNSIIKDKSNKLVNRGLGILISLLSIRQIGSVSAAATDVCCLETNGGAKCQDVPWNYGECSSGLSHSVCEQTSDCRQICCIDEEEGLCTTNSPMHECTSNGGIWDSDKSCNVDACIGGCCILGGSSDWVTERRCQLLSAQKGFRGTNFTQHVSQAQCLRMRENQKTGACVLDGGMCRFGTEADCVEMAGRFEEDELCSSPSLNTTCLKQYSVGCVEGKDEIYWLDSCGNMENIYSSNKEDSWNDGNVLTKSESCNTNSANINSATCGNCNFMLGSKCQASSLGKKVEDGNFICADVNCVDEKGVKRKNGESWCVYDGTVMGGLNENRSVWATDIVGSRHWRRMCVDGVVKNEPCADFRQQVCGKIEIAGKEANESDTIESSESVGCVQNRWRECVEVTNEIYSGQTGDFKAQKTLFQEWDEAKSAEYKKKCEDIGQCIFYEMKLSKTPIVPVCMPMFSGGLDFYNNVENSTSTAEDVCNIVTSIPYIGTCTKVTLTGDCSGCVSGCDCGTEKWLEEVNAIANAFGDCGAYVNIGGEVTDFGYSSTKGKNESKKGEVEWTRLNESYLNPLKRFWENITEEDVIINYNLIGLNNTNLSIPGKVKSGGGTPTIKGGILGEQTAFSGIVGEIIYNPYMSVAGYIPLWGDISYWVIRFFAEIFELFGLGSILGVADCGIKKTQYHYRALPWQAPVENQKCEQCGEDITKPCTEYRCKSLGAACELTNIDEENPTCFESNKSDITPPTLSLDNVKELSFIVNETKTYTLEKTNQGVHVLAYDEECVPEFTPIIFEFETNEHAQCKVEYEKTNAFEEMSDYLGGRNLFLKNHTTLFYAPSIGSLSVYDVSGDAKEMFGNMNMYVRCQDTHGNTGKNELVVNFCIRSGPDFTPAVVIGSRPGNNAFIPYNSSEIVAKIFLNEPADCKWSKNSNLTYSEMNNQMDCSHELLNTNGFGWECNTTLTGLKKGSNSFYILCKDQPWLDDSNESRNINAQVFNYTLIGTDTPLKIDSVTPNGIIYSGFEPVSVDIIVKTSGGAQSGKAKCRYDITNRGWEDLFYETDSIEHKQTFSSLMEGDYSIKVSCVDIGGNFVEKETSLKVELDKSSPYILRAYRDGSNLVLVTNENAECVYNKERCDYVFNNGTSITSTGFSQIHNAEWNGAITYYIKCRDVFGNAPSGCTIIAKPSLIS